jgi:hypothetical protein
MTQSLARRISGHNASHNRAPDAHISEAVAQTMLAELLRNKLPSHTLVRENQAFSEHSALKGLVPDIIIDSVHDEPWGVAEMKMLLNGDSLSVREVEGDLFALSDYKKSIPNLAAYFLLIGSRDKLFNRQREEAWDSLKISYNPRKFLNATRQKIGNGYSAVPAGQYNVVGDSIVVFRWEIIPGEKGPVVRTSDYAFEASMI